MIQETKDVVKFLCSLGTGLAKAEEDHQITLGDALFFMKALKDIGPALDGVDRVPQEIWSMSDAEAAELSTEIQDELELPAEKIKIIVEEAIKALPHLIAMYKAVNS